MDNDLPQINSLALNAGSPGQPSDGQALASDCQAYGVTISLWGPLARRVVMNHSVLLAVASAAALVSLTFNGTA